MEPLSIQKSKKSTGEIDYEEFQIFVRNQKRLKLSVFKIVGVKNRKVSDIFRDLSSMHLTLFFP